MFFVNASTELNAQMTKDRAMKSEGQAVTSRTKIEKPIMNSSAKLLLGMGILCLALTTSGRAQSLFFRTVSTQATDVVSFDRSGVLTWSNSIPGAPCAIESAPALSGAWSTYLDPVIVTGAVASVRIPLGSPEPAVPAKYLFEVSMENHTWGHYYYGLYVDHSGFVYSYYAVPPSFTDPLINTFYPAPYPAAYLDMKTALNRRYVGTESRTNLEAMLALVSAAAQGPLSPPQGVGADQGVIMFKAFVYNEPQTNYSVVLLKRGGDWRITNSAPQAAVLTQWLSNWWVTAKFPPVML
jgi:hypothetical protein